MPRGNGTGQSLGLDSGWGTAAIPGGCHEARRGHWGLSGSPACAQPPFPSDSPVESVRQLGTELGSQTQGLDGQKLEVAVRGRRWRSVDHVQEDLGFRS